MNNTAALPPPTQRIAVGYLRRSSVSSDRPGDASHEVQTKAIEAMAGSSVVLYEDWGVSGAGSKTHKRTNYLRLRDDIAAGKVSAVYAYSLSRLARSTKELADLAELCERTGTTLATFVDKIDTSSATGRLFFTILSGLAQFESDLAKERVTAAIEATRANGTYKNRVTFGYELVTDASGKVQRVNNGKADKVIAAYETAGSAFGAALLLNESKVPTSTGKGVWGSATVARMVSAHRPDLLPTVKPSGKRRIAKQGLWGQVVRCGKCPRMLTIKSSKHHSLYCSAGRATNDHPELVKFDVLLPFIKAEAAKYMPNGVRTLQAVQDEQQRDSLVAKRERIGELYADGGLTREAYKRRTAEIDAELAKFTEGDRLLASITPMPQPIDWTTMSEAEIGDLLRGIWHYVALGPDMKPSHVEWRVDARFYDEGTRDAVTIEADRIAVEASLAA